MPQETIHFPAAYVVIGAYRLMHDKALWKPMYIDIKGAAQKAALLASAWVRIRPSYDEWQNQNSYA